MIIRCNNCSKIFEVNSSLIPSNGRNIQCGSCKFTWFYNPSIESTSKISPEENISKEVAPEEKIDKELINKDISSETEKVKKQFEKNKKRVNFKLSKILSYLLVGIISFIALIIVLETFKSPLGNIFSGLELLLYNLFETIKDVFLFIKDLFI